MRARLPQGSMVYEREKFPLLQREFFHPDGESKIAWERKRTKQNIIPGDWPDPSYSRRRRT